ncbi:hypothetical protein D3C76_1383330 [compost metagenome]
MLDLLQDGFPPVLHYRCNRNDIHVAADKRTNGLELLALILFGILHQENDSRLPGSLPYGSTVRLPPGAL